MKKILTVIGLLILAWMVKLSYDVWHFDVQQNHVLNEIHQIEQSTANLNDQIVALQRQKEQVNSQATSAPLPSSSEPVIEGVDPIVLIQQQLDLVEFALEQRQYVVATDKLAVLSRQLEEYPLAVTLRQSLYQVIARDIEHIQQFVKEKNEQHMLISRQLQGIDQLLNREQKQPQLQINPSPEQPVWKRWFQLEPAEAPATALMQRQIILKEAQLRLLLARQALASGQYVEYQQNLEGVIVLIQALPDAQAQALLKQLKKLKNLVILTPPILSTRALLE